MEEVVEGVEGDLVGVVVPVDVPCPRDNHELSGVGGELRVGLLGEAARDFYPDWDGAADICVAILRTEAGRDPHDKELHDLVGELSTRSEEFRRRWSSNNVRTHGAGTKTFHHHEVGDLELAYESVDMISDPGLSLTLYAAQPGSPTAQALDLLASWVTPTTSSRPAT